MMPEGENEQEHRWQGEDGKSFRMMWQLFRPGYGNTVELTTGGRSCNHLLNLSWLDPVHEDALVQSCRHCTAEALTMTTPCALAEVINVMGVMFS